jgi:hypothetical protein
MNYGETIRLYRKPSATQRGMEMELKGKYFDDAKIKINSMRISRKVVDSCCGQARSVFPLNLRLHLTTS